MCAPPAGGPSTVASGARRDAGDVADDRLLRSGLVGKRVVFMGDDPAIAVPPQSDCQPEPVAWVALELLQRAATQQSVREGHVLPGGDVERDDLERCTVPLPGEEWGPGLAVGGDPAYAVFRRWHVEHDDVVAVIGENRIQVSAVHRTGPVLDERPI